jgi:hypothetical protein
MKRWSILFELICCDVGINNAPRLSSLIKDTITAELKSCGRWKGCLFRTGAHGCLQQTPVEWIRVHLVDQPGPLFFLFRIR